MSVVIPNSITEIGNCVFYYCINLTNVNIGESVTWIDSSALFNCKSLTDVYYTGSEDDWSNITIHYGNSPLTGATIHYNYSAE